MAKKSTKKLEKQLKKIHPLTIFFVVIFLLVGVGAGFGTFYLLTKNDKFEFVGGSEITINVGEKFIASNDDVVIVAFGKDISDSVEIFGDVDPTTKELDTSVDGKYVIKYKVNHIRFKDHILYKLVTVVNP